MGASVSTNAQTLQNTMITTAVQSCPPVSGSNVINWTGVDFTAPPDCPGGGNFVFSQAAVVDANCALSSLQSTAANTVANLSASAQAGLGFAVSTNVADNVTNIQNYTNQQCAGTSTTNLVNFSDVKINACNLTVTQNATENVNCQLNATQGIINTIATNTAAQAQGASLFGLLFGGGRIGIFILVIAIIVILGGIAAAYFKTKGNKKSVEAGLNTELADDIQEGGYTDSFGNTIQKNKPYIILIVIALLLVIVFMVNRSPSAARQITESDVNNLNQTISEAHKIAGLSPQQPQTITNNNYYSDNSDNSDNSDYSHSQSSESEPSYYPIGYDHRNMDNTLDDYYRPLLY